MVSDITPDRILGIGFGFFSAKTLMTAVELGVFTRIASAAGQSMSRSALEKSLGLHPRGTDDFLDALVAMKFLSKTHEGSEAIYKNTQETDLYLDEHSSHYIGGILIMANRRLYKYWNDLGEALKTGRPQSEVKYQQKGLFDEIFQDQAKLEDFCSAMTGLSRQNFTKFTELFSFSPYKIHLDVGASMGLLSHLVVQKSPTIRSIAFDLPEVTPVTKKALKAWGCGDKVEVVSGSFLKDDLPKADLITMGNILHDWNLETKKLILKKAFDALLPGGALVVIENIIDDQRSENAFGLLMSLNMLIEFGDAFDFTFKDFEGWCQEIGFSRFERLAVHGPCSAAIAYKDK